MIKDINNHNLNISTKIEEQAKKIDELVTRNEFLEEVAKKSDKQSMNNALNRKVNKSDLDMLLEKYADKSEIMQIKDNQINHSVTKVEFNTMDKKINEIRGFNDSILSFKEKINKLDEKQQSQTSIEAQFEEFKEKQSKLCLDRIEN